MLFAASGYDYSNFICVRYKLNDGLKIMIIVANPTLKSTSCYSDHIILDTILARTKFIHIIVHVCIYHY